MPEFYTAAEVARIARLTTWTVRRLLREGAFPGAIKPKSNGKWLIPQEDLAEYLQNTYGRREE